jgi:hypothetical protein
VVIQVLEVEHVPPGSQVRVGVYNPVTQQRLLTESGDEFIVLPLSISSEQ